MRDRTFADFIVGALTCISVLGLCVVIKDTELYRESERRRANERWELPRRRRRSRSPEDDCRHCTGTGLCAECTPAPCRVCRGTGVQPRDAGVAGRLALLWDGAA